MGLKDRGICGHLTEVLRGRESPRFLRPGDRLRIQVPLRVSRRHIVASCLFVAEPIPLQATGIQNQFCVPSPTRKEKDQ